SPNLTFLDFLLWSVIKLKVYSRDNRNTEELKGNAVLASEELKDTHNALQGVHNNLVQRAQLCMQYHGRHFEQILQ
ncbi:hypothetical protein WH47_01656, partial [Habropoda laboriosa]